MSSNFNRAPKPQPQRKDWTAEAKEAEKLSKVATTEVAKARAKLLATPQWKELQDKKKQANKAIAKEKLCRDRAQADAEMAQLVEKQKRAWRGR